MRCGWAKRTSSPIAGPGRVHAPVPPTIKGPNRPTCSVRSAPNAEPAPPWCCRPAIPKLCSFTSMRSQPKSLQALTLFSSSIKPGGMAPRLSRFQATSRSCSSRHARPNSTAKKISGSSCGRTGCRTEFSNPSTTSSITAATPGTRSSISRGKSCPSPAAIGQPQVTQFEDWYKRLRLLSELVPKAARIAVIVNPTSTATAEPTIRDVHEAATTIGLQIQILNAATIGEIDAAFATLARERPDALYVAPDSFFTSRRGQFATLTARDRIPAAYSQRDFVSAGGLMSYGTDIPDMFRQM